MVNSSEKENAIVELLRQNKPYSEIEQQLHVSSRDISHTKKKYEGEQNKIQSQSEVQSEVVPSDLHVTEQHKDQNTGTLTKVNKGTQQDDINEALTNINKELIEEKLVLEDIMFSQREEIQVLKVELNCAGVKRRSGIIAVKTESLYDEVRFLLNRDAEYCYLIYEDNKFKRLVDALLYEEDLTKQIERAKEQRKQETTNRLEVHNDGSIF